MDNAVIDISDLPEKAQAELYSFYEFLKNKYQNNEKKHNLSKLVPRKVSSFKFLTRQEANER